MDFPGMGEAEDVLHVVDSVFAAQGGLGGVVDDASDDVSADGQVDFAGDSPGDVVALVVAPLELPPLS